VPNNFITLFLAEFGSRLLFESHVFSMVRHMCVLLGATAFIVALAELIMNGEHDIMDALSSASAFSFFERFHAQGNKAKIMHLFITKQMIWTSRTPPAYKCIKVIKNGPLTHHDSALNCGTHLIPSQNMLRYFLPCLILTHGRIKPSQKSCNFVAQASSSEADWNINVFNGCKHEAGD
jgi:hypothetical protein